MTATVRANAEMTRISSIDIVRGAVMVLMAIDRVRVYSGFCRPAVREPPDGRRPPPPEGYAWSLPLLYLVWAIAVVILYVACRWYAQLKTRRHDWWLRYVMSNPDSSS